MPRTDAIPALPDFIAPMLARPGNAFDSDAYLFEIKWDGTRALAFMDDDGYRLVNRRRADLTARYPDLSVLSDLPAGAVLDGEIVVLRDGKPDFAALLSREQARSPLKWRTLAQTLPATYIVFDLLYDRGQSVMDLPFSERRRRLGKLLARREGRGLVLSQGVIGAGQDLFREAVALGLEGVMAKRLDSRYVPGERSDAWIKIKRSLECYCIVIGFLPSGRKDFRSLVLAMEENGELRCVGKVGSGVDDAMRRRLNAWLWTHLQPRPVIPCREKAKWVEPRLVCKVTCMERSSRGELRAPAFKELIRE